MPSLRAVLGYDSAVYKARYTCIAVNNLHQTFPAAASQAGSATAFGMSTCHVRKGQMRRLADRGVGEFAVYKGTFVVYKAKEHACCESSQKQTVDRISCRAQAACHLHVTEDPA